MKKLVVVIVYDDVFARDRMLTTLAWGAIENPLHPEEPLTTGLTDMRAAALRKMLTTGQGKFDSYVDEAEYALLVGADTAAQDLLYDVEMATRELKNKGDSLEILTLSGAIAQKCREGGMAELQLRREPTHEIDRHIYQHFEQGRATYTFAEGQDELEMYVEMAWGWAKRKMMGE